MAYRTYRPRRSRTRRRRSASPLAVLLLLIVAAVTGWLLAAPEAAGNDAPETFACPSPYIHDGDNIRCADGPNSRLYGIDAPEMPGACRPGRQCTPGNPYAARDHLRALVATGPVECERLDTDRYNRPILRCTAAGVDLSCAQVEAGHAVERYGRLEC